MMNKLDFLESTLITLITPKRLLLVLMMINQAPNHIPVVNQFSNILQRNNKIKIKQIKVKKVMNNMNMIIYRQILI